MGGDVGHDDPDSGYPIKIGGKAEATVPTPTGDGDRVNAWFDTYGRQVAALKDTAGAEVIGEVQASPTANTVLARLKDLLTGIVLSAGSALLGKVGIDQTTPGTTNGVQVNAALPAGTNAIGKLAANSGVDIGDVDVTSIAAGDNNIGNVDVASDPVFGTIACGELAGSATAAVMPTQACRMVKFKAVWSNAGKVYIGGSGVTKVDGTTDTTTGIELSAGEETGWLPVSNLNVFYRISDNAGDDLTYLAMVS